MFLTTNETTLWVHFREKKVISSEQLVSKTPIPNKTCVLYKRKDGDYGLIETK